jgi:hypothetical protein
MRDSQEVDTSARIALERPESSIVVRGAIQHPFQDRIHPGSWNDCFRGVLLVWLQADACRVRAFCEGVRRGYEHDEICFGR